MDPNQQQGQGVPQYHSDQQQPYFPPPPPNPSAPSGDSSQYPYNHPTAGGPSPGTEHQHQAPPPQQSGVAPSSHSQTSYLPPPAAAPPSYTHQNYPSPPSGGPPATEATQQGYNDYKPSIPLQSDVKDESQQPYYPPPPHGGPPQGYDTGVGTQQPSSAPYNNIDPQSQAPPPLPDRPPQRQQAFNFGDDNTSDPTHYTRDPHKLIAYLVPFPVPTIKGTEKKPPMRFLIYTPPPPPIPAPAEGQKENRITQVQRKWQNSVREAKTSNAKVTSWKGAKGKVTKGVNWAMSQTKSSNLEFLNRIPGKSSENDPHTDDGKDEGETTHKTVGLEEMVLIYPASLPGTQEELREEFVNNMLRTKSKAQRDTVIATGLIPVAFAVDILATFIWPFGGLGEIDTVWAVASFRGAKTSRSVTKRLNSTDTNGSGQQLRMTFTPSPRLEVLSAYLAAECRHRDQQLFRGGGMAPTETQAVEAIGWAPSQIGGQTKNWEDEQWELQEVKDDLKQVMHKGAREWDKWCKAFEKDPEKALKK